MIDPLAGNDLALFKLVAERMPGIAWTTDAELRVTACLGAGMEAAGIHPREVVGRPLAEFFRSADDPAAILDAHRRALSVEAVDFDCSWSGRPYRVHLEPLRDATNRVTGCIGFAHESAGIFRKFAEASEEGCGMSDFDGRILYVNPAMCRMFGEERPEDVIGRHVSTYYPPEYVQKRQTEMIPALLQEGRWRSEQTTISRDGRAIPTRQTAFLIRDENGNPLRIAVVISDITERNRTEEGLRQSHEELQAIYDGMVDGLLIADVATRRFVRANPAICSMLGYSEEEVVSLAVTDIHPGEVLPDVLRAFDEQAARRLRIAHDLPVLRKNGSVFYADIATNVLTYQGRTCMIGIFRDVSERKRAEEAVRQSHDELQAIYDGMSDGLLIADLDTKDLLRANPAICQMLGYSMAELLSMTVVDIHPAEDIPAILKRFAERAAGMQRSTASNSLVRKDGSVLSVDIVSNTLVYQGRPCVVGFFRDVTERKRAQEALRQSHDELRAIYDQMMDGMIIADIEKIHPVRANSAYGRMLGYSDEEMYSLSPDRVHPPEVLPKVWEHLNEVKNGNVARIEDLPFLRKDGSVVFADVISGPIRYNDRPCWICFFHDVTGRKRAQDALEREHRTLEHMLHASDHERQVIAYEIHDGLAQQLAGAIMQFDSYAYHKDREPQAAADAFQAGMTMLRQSHFEARRLISGVRPPILDEAGVVAALAHLVHEESRKKGPKIEYRSKVAFQRLPPTLENAIYRIVQEGVNNACRHSKSKRVKVELAQRGEMVRIEVRDHGIGFTPEDIGDSRFGVEGIRERARLLGGSALVESQPGKGTRIIVELPIVPRRTEDEA